MEDRRTQIERALEKLTQRKRWLDFQYLVLQLAKQKWPDLEPTEWWHDGGEDGITIPSQGGDGLKKSLACSLWDFGEGKIRLTMSVDLIFAAELVRLVEWNRLTTARTELSSALRSWYARPEEPRKECALAAMLATGSADFQDIFIPLMESDDLQVRLRFYRVWKPFPLTCLCDEWSQRLARWPEEHRAEFIHEMMWDADTAHHQLAESSPHSRDRNPEARLGEPSRRTSTPKYRYFD